MSGDPTVAIIFPFIIQCIGIVIFFILHRWELPLPFAALVFLAGIGLGIVGQNDSNDPFSTSIREWSHINSQLLLVVFLPGLIFRDAIQVNFQAFLLGLPQILLLAFPMVLLGTLLTALFVGRWMLPSWPWTLAAILGSVLSSTDPIAVSSVLQKAGAPPRLQMQIGGESLLNDGSAFVLFAIFSEMFLADMHIGGSQLNVAEGIAMFCRMSLGGTAMGLAFAGGLLLVLFELDRKLDPDYNVLQVLAALSFAYWSYYVANQFAGMSGIVSCVVCGITTRGIGSKGLINDPVLLNSYLALMEHALNTLLFALGGVVWGEVIMVKNNNEGATWADWVNLLLMYVLVMSIRFFSVAVFYPIFSRLGLKSSLREATFLAYGGMRGAVGIALALSLKQSVQEVTDDPSIQALTIELEFFAGGISFLSLFLNGSFAGLVLKTLGLAKPTTSRRRAVRMFELSAEEYVAEQYHHLTRQPRFSDVSPIIVQAHVPFFTPPTTPVKDDDDEEAAYSEHLNPMDSETYRRFLSSSSTLNMGEDAILSDLRFFFLELLKESYLRLLATGELDERENNGANIDVLIQSVAFSATNVEHGEPIQDWKFTQMFPSWDSAMSWFRRGPACETHHSAHQPLQQPRIAVLRALAFIGAHRLAEQKLLRDRERALFESMDSEGMTELVNDAVEKVLEESKEQRKQAFDFLDTFPKEQLDSIKSHYLCTIILRRLSTFVQTCLNEGTLTQLEARGYLERTDHCIRNAQECPTNHQAKGTSRMLKDIVSQF